MFRWFIPRKVSLYYGSIFGLKHPCWYLTDGETNFENQHGLVVKVSSNPDDLSANVVMANGHYYYFTKEFHNLYRRFAQLPFERPPFSRFMRQAYLQFAEQFGLLSGDIQTAASLDLPPNAITEDLKHIRAEPIHIWMGEVSQMRGAIALHRALIKEDVDFLREHIGWGTPEHKGRGELIGMYYHHRSTETLHKNDQDRWGFRVTGEMLYDYPYVDGTPTDLDYLEAGKRHLNLWVSRGLMERTRAMLWPDETGTLIVSTQPNCLIGQLWLQFANDIARQQQVKYCPGCGKEILILNRAGSRGDKTYCSSACRQRRYRQRKRGKAEG